MLNKNPELIITDHTKYIVRQSSFMDVKTSAI